MAESESTSARRSKSSGERLCKFCKFGTVVQALWKTKPALQLAQRMRVSERNALQIMRGERRVTAKAIHVVNAEMLD